MRGFGRGLVGGVGVKTTDKIERIVLRDVVVEHHAAAHEGEEGKKYLETGLSAFDVIIREEAAADHVLVP